GCLGLRPEEKDHIWQVEKVLAGLGFSLEDMNRSPREFSGGFQVRINLARSLVARPDMLLLDEPTNYLDIVSIRWLSRFFKLWKGELMIITHDRSFMDSICTHTVIIHRHNVRKTKGGTEKLLGQIRQEEEIHEKTRFNEEKKRKQEELFISRFRAKARLAGMVQSRIKSLEKKEKLDKLEQIKNLKFSFTWASCEGRRLLETRNLGFSYNPEQTHLIRNFSLDIGRHDRIAVIGQNGRGKSTLLKMLAGELDPQHGKLTGHPLLKVGYYSQDNASHLDPSRTVEEEIMSSGQHLERKQARDICGAMMFQGDLALKKISVLSGGEKCRVCLGKLLVSPCNLILLDEPANHLDQESCEALMDAIQSFKGAVMIVTHNQRFLKHIPDRLVVFDRGRHRLIERGYQDFLAEVGWSSEEGWERTSTDRAKNQGPNKKELRKLRADILQEKSRALRGLKVSINKLEKDIMNMESEIHRKNEELNQPSGQVTGKDLAELSKSVYDLQANANSLYDELDRVTREYEEEERRYQERLDSVVSGQESEVRGQYGANNA
ncbi:ABC-F family ATP-binding cassette domain-containing protein, partial [Fibrobacterota bacterium]